VPIIYDYSFWLVTKWGCWQNKQIARDTQPAEKPLVELCTEPAEVLVETISET